MLQLGEAQTQTKKNIVDVKQNNGSNKATIKKKKNSPFNVTRIGASSVVCLSRSLTWRETLMTEL